MSQVVPSRGCSGINRIININNTPTPTVMHIWNIIDGALKIYDRCTPGQLREIIKKQTTVRSMNHYERHVRSKRNCVFLRNKATMLLMIIPQPCILHYCNIRMGLCKTIPKIEKNAYNIEKLNRSIRSYKSQRNVGDKQEEEETKRAQT